MKILEQSKLIRPLVVKLPWIDINQLSRVLRKSSEPPADNTAVSATGNKTFPCKNCEKEFSTLTRLRRHRGKFKLILGVHYNGDRDRNYICLRCGCGKRHSTQEALEAHQLTHSKEKPFTCHYCGKTFTMLGARNYHTRKHCPLNNSVTKEHTVVYQKTVQRISGDSAVSDPFSCEICDRQFEREVGLRIHQRKHGIQVTSEYSCQVCLKILSTRVGLNRHIATHSGEKVFKCPTCEKYFARKDGLQAHVRIGSCKGKKYVFTLPPEPKSFACHKCQRPRTFSTKQGLRIHNRRVHGIVEGPYLCFLCGDGKHWPSNGHLQIHMVTHTKEKCFKCPLCNSNFGSKRAVVCHINTRNCRQAAASLKHETAQPLSDHNEDCIVKTFTRNRSLGICQVEKIIMEAEAASKSSIDLSSSTSPLRKSVEIIPRTKANRNRNSKSKQYECSFCGSKQGSPSSLEVHMKTHTKEKPFKCPACSLFLSTRGALMTHGKACPGPLDAILSYTAKSPKITI